MNIGRRCARCHRLVRVVLLRELPPHGERRGVCPACAGDIAEGLVRAMNEVDRAVNSYRG